jgi:hypothetical protein
MTGELRPVDPDGGVRMTANGSCPDGEACFATLVTCIDGRTRELDTAALSGKCEASFDCTHLPLGADATIVFLGEKTRLCTVS